MSFIFILAAFLAYFLRIEVKWALLSLFLVVLGGGSREADSKEVDSKEAANKVVDGKVAHSKNIGSGKAGSGKVSRFLADFALFLLLLSTKSYKECSSIYFLKLY